MGSAADAAFTAIKSGKRYPHSHFGRRLRTVADRPTLPVSREETSKGRMKSWLARALSTTSDSASRWKKTQTRIQGQPLLIALLFARVLDYYTLRVHSSPSKHTHTRRLHWNCRVWSQEAGAKCTKHESRLRNLFLPQSCSDFAWSL